MKTDTVSHNPNTNKRSTMNDYPAIRAWGANLGSLNYYIDTQVQLARETGAPADAIYRITNIDGSHAGWRTVRDVTNHDTLWRLKKRGIDISANSEAHRIP